MIKSQNLSYFEVYKGLSYVVTYIGLLTQAATTGKP